MNTNEIQTKIGETIENVRLETKRLRKRRKPVLPYILGIAFLVWIIVSMGSTNTDNRERIRQLEQRQTKSYQELKSDLDKLKNDKKIKDDEYQKRLNELQAKRDERVKLASVQPARPKPVQRVGSNTSCESYRGLVAQYPWNVEVALAVMKAESGCNPNATHVNNNGSVDHGLFQLNNINVHDPAENIRIAYQQKYASRGWQPWVVCTRGIVRCI